MANNLYLAPTVNYKQTTLNGAITSGAGTITLNSAANLQSPGYIVIDRVDSNGVSTPTAREVVSYTGVSGSNLTGCTRGADNSSAQSHSDGAVVETMPTVGMWNSLATILVQGMTTDGYLNAINSPVSIAIGRFNVIAVNSVASITEVESARLVTSAATIPTSLNVANASVVGLGISPAFIGPGFYSGVTTAIGGLLIAPRPATLQWVSAVTKYVASGVSVGFNFLVRNTTVFSNVTATLAIPAGGTFASTASLAVTNVNKGDILQADISAMIGGAGAIQEVTVQAGGA